MSKKHRVVVGGREYTKESIRKLIEDNADARLKALMVIYSYQTDHEKCVGHNSDLNGVGFNKVDVERLTDLAQWFLRNGYVRLKEGKKHEYDLLKRGALTNKQDDFLSWKMPKYSGQIWKLMVEKYGLAK